MTTKTPLSATLHVITPHAQHFTTTTPKGTTGGALSGTGGEAGTMLFHVLYGTFKGTIGIIGLKPIYLAYLVGAIILLAFLAQIRGAFKGSKSWSLEDRPRDDL